MPDADPYSYTLKSLARCGKGLLKIPEDVRVVNECKAFLCVMNGENFKEMFMVAECDSMLFFVVLAFVSSAVEMISIQGRPGVSFYGFAT